MRYQDIHNIFPNHDIDLTAAEAQGLATGMLCFAEKADVKNWLEQLWDIDVSLSEENQSDLTELFEFTRNGVNDTDGFSYQLFLPDDDAPLKEQMTALVTWCEGFLFGVGFSENAENWPAEIREILQDMVEMTQMDIDIDDSDMEKTDYEDHVAALMEIQEYLRTAVMLIKDYLTTENKEATH